MSRGTSRYLWKNWRLLGQRSPLITVVIFSILFELVSQCLGNPSATASPIADQLQAQAASANSLSTPLTLAQLQNLTYQVPILGSVTLVNGSY